MFADIEMLVMMEYLDMGLIPPNMDANKALCSLKDLDSRMHKRKLRKVFRKLVKSDEHIYAESYLKTVLGYPGKPNKSQKRNRRIFVHEIITRKIIRHNRKSISSGMFRRSVEND